MSILLRICLLWLASMGWSVGVAAQSPGADHQIAVRIDVETLQPVPGSTASIAFVMTPNKGWHDYWLNPGDAGGPLTVEWSLPPGVTAGPLQFPVPSPLLINGFMNHVYDAPHAILADLSIGSDVAAGTIFPVTAKARWFACSDRLCVPEEATFLVQLVAGIKGGNNEARFDAWRAALPSPLDRAGRYSVSGKAIAIAIPFPASAEAGPVHFFAATEGVLQYAAPQKARRRGDWLIVESVVEKASTRQIEGLLRIGAGHGLWVKASPGVVPSGGESIGVVGGDAMGKSTNEAPSLPLLLLGALLGGLLLNIMPCVFPILGLKALSLAKAGGHESEARRDALAYSAGVILSCLALGGLMLALRAGGQQVGWAFQLQSPGFVLFLLLLMIAVTANLAGLFELKGFEAGGGLSRRPGLIGSFWTGALAAIVATPCTGPFMAAATGAALVLPTAQALLLFAALGLGIALPFLLIAYVPALRRMLPKSGPWLGTFRKVMAVPMGLTALALLWLLSRLSGDMGLLVGGLAAVALVLVFLFIRSAQRLNYAVLAATAATAFILLIALKWLPDAGASSSRSIAENKLNAIAFSEEKLAALRSQEKPVFLYFTADWCITCKVNEASAIQTAQTAEAFNEAEVVTMEGDFTRSDPAIAGFLARHGRVGVPLYLYYAPGKGAEILPQLLAPGSLAEIVAANSTNK
jgi:DsbC/DsbD-like thiol-disulfide interchange protein/cytochrome c biogenesis protein CcdA